MASAVYIGKAQGEEGKKKNKTKNIKKEPKLSRGGEGSSFLLMSFGSVRPHASRMHFPLLAK